MEGFLDLNSSPHHPFEYFRGSLKQTMLDHDIIFKKQACGSLGKSLMKSDSKFTRCETFPMKRTFTGNHSARFLIDNLFSQEEDDDDDLNLSLSIGRSTNKRSKSWKNKIIIDLEEDSSGIGSSEDVQPVFSLDQSSQKSTDHINQYPCHGMIDCLVNGVNLHKGSSELHDDVKQTKLMDFDLNEDQPDESFQSNEPSSDLTEEKERNISQVIEEKVKNDSDYATKKAAHSLVSISLQQISSNQDSESKSGSNEVENKKTNPRRSSSIDSYEFLVLKLEESCVDEDCVTSKAFELNEMGKNKNDKGINSIKLRRGRRMKDFQKDILPTLSSLSQHEIWEDIKILEGVIRSREYKRLQKAKTENGDNCVKNKRSKVNYAGQRSCLPKRK
ncbi:unnamed protein product [Lactuca saligna]|uniref:Uncharacterized protein n=1 Tax=Lactuca saligna TaxID=75948 RepID=A0AA35ZAS0_LACSI|nr:unnamed protein product [Lactuca saligna]